MNRIYLCILVGVQMLVSNTTVFSQNDPTSLPQINVTNKYFPESLICSEAISGDGPTVDRIIIGTTKINELVELYKDEFVVSSNYIEAANESFVEFRQPDSGNIVARLSACVDNNETIVTLKGTPPKPSVEIDILPTPLPGFRLVGLTDLVHKYGEPEVVTYSFSPYHRIAFWFSEGIAAKIYVNQIEPSAFGAISQSEIVHFTYQDFSDYTQVWPYIYTYPEWIPVGDENVPSTPPQWKLKESGKISVKKDMIDGPQAKLPDST